MVNIYKKGFITALSLIINSSVNAAEINTTTSNTTTSNTTTSNTTTSNTNLVDKTSSSVDAPRLQTIRFYRANKHQQKIRLNISKSKTDQLGCHNFKRSRRIATIVQIGYQTCSIYTKKDCDIESTIRANHSDQGAFSQLLTQGYGWLPKPQSEKDQRGVKLRSWSCQ